MFEDIFTQILEKWNYIINTKRRFHTDEKLFELFCIKNGFAKYFAKCCNSFAQIFCFVHCDNFSKWYKFYRTNQISLRCIKIKKLIMLKIITANNLVLTCRLKTIILCFLHSVWFVKYVFSAKTWFVKNSTRIMKHKSQIIKSNLGICWGLDHEILWKLFYLL